MNTLDERWIQNKMSLMLTSLACAQRSLLGATSAEHPPRAEELKAALVTMQTCFCNVAADANGLQETMRRLIADHKASS